MLRWRLQTSSERQAFVPVTSLVRIDCGHLPRHFVQVDLVICLLKIQSGELLATGEFGISPWSVPCRLISARGQLAPPNPNTPQARSRQFWWGCPILLQLSVPLRMGPDELWKIFGNIQPWARTWLFGHRQLGCFSFPNTEACFCRWFFSSRVSIKLWTCWKLVVARTPGSRNK